MFVSHDKNINKKKFQKPNILRRKSKNPSVKLTITAQSCESSEGKSYISPLNVNESKICEIQGGKIIKRKNIKPGENAKKLPLRTKTDDIIPYEVQISTVESNKIEINLRNNLPSFGASTDIASNIETEDHSPLNVNSFLVSGTDGEGITLLDNDLLQSKIADGRQKWCFDFINSPKLILEECEGSQLEGVYVEQKSDVITTMVPLSAVSSVQHEGSYTLPAEQIPDDMAIQKLSVDQFFARSHKFKCDAPDCEKEFMSEQKLKKHKNIHNKNGNTRVQRQTITECPVKIIQEDGSEEACGMIFQMREDLLKHLKEEHKPEDAVYRCEECGRRFFWASGLRAHGRAHRSRRPRAALACAWPGCGRVFRQPCRLREHTRAHTGDKPYPCRYPNCGWSFRTASKLMRHARRHTGERRHACAACGRAFLRREHLRDHAARHHDARAARPPRNSRTILVSEENFNNIDSLSTHMDKVDEKVDTAVAEAAISIDTQQILKTDSENLFMVTYMPESPEMDTASKVEVEPESVELSLCGEGELECEAGDAGEAGEAGDGGEGEAGGGRAARTHCTWPLARAHAYQAPDAYVLEEDAQVEHSEISENNIYTVRSDLFLHGNVLTNEDSEHMASCATGSLDTELLLAPSVDLAQEELYTDAVDESAFRVFLLSGEDLA